LPSIVTNILDRRDIIFIDQAVPETPDGFVNDIALQGEVEKNLYNKNQKCTLSSLMI